MIFSSDFNKENFLFPADLTDFTILFFINLPNLLDLRENIAISF